MKERFDVFIKAIEKYIPGDLISKKNLEALSDFASLFPAKLSSFWGFECRIGKEDPKADFLLCITSQGEEREIFGNIHPEEQLAESLQKDPLWDRVKEFGKVWADPDSRLHGKADDIWMEFDTARTDTYKNPIPSFFFGSQYSNRLSIEEHCEWTLNDALRILTGGAVPPALAGKISAAFNLLPAHAHIFQIGMMLSRPLHTIRLCIAGLSAQEYRDYLESLEWEGDTKQLCAFINELYTVACSVKMNIDILNGEGNAPFIGPKIGLECYLDRHAKNIEDKRRKFLDYFVNKNLCTENKRSALIAYEGYSDEWRDREIWPAHLKQSYFLAGLCDSSVIVRYLNHIKVVWQRSKPLEAKAYLAVSSDFGKTVF